MTCARRRLTIYRVEQLSMVPSPAHGAMAIIDDSGVLWRYIAPDRIHAQARNGVWVPDYFFEFGTIRAFFDSASAYNAGPNLDSPVLWSRTLTGTGAMTIYGGDRTWVRSTGGGGGTAYWELTAPFTSRRIFVWCRISPDRSLLSFPVHHYIADGVKHQYWYAFNNNPFSAYQWSGGMATAYIFPGVPLFDFMEVAVQCNGTDDWASKEWDQERGHLINAQVISTFPALALNLYRTGCVLASNQQSMDYQGFPCILVMDATAGP